MEELKEWFQTTKLGHFMYLMIFLVIFYLIFLVIWPNFLNVGFFIGGGITSALLSIFDDNDNWY